MKKEVMPLNTYLLVFFRILTIMSLLLTVNLLLTGKRLVGEMPIFDFLVVITMGSLVGADIADPNIEHLPTAFALVVLGIFQFTMNKFILNSRKFSKLVTFEPTLIMENGQFLVNNMKKIRYTLDKILMLMREKDIFDLKDVQYGIIEPNGKLTVLKKAELMPLTPKDMSLSVTPHDIPIPVVLEGRLDEVGIKEANLDKNLILRLLKEQGYEAIDTIFFAAYSLQQGLQIYPYQRNNSSIDIQH